MRLLHTADWHLGDRLGRIDRSADLRRAIERIADVAKVEAVDVILVAGDLFSELARPDNLRETIRHWQTVFAPFLAGGGTLLTLTGNHDNENFCQTLQHAMSLAAPWPADPHTPLPRGRLYLATAPVNVTLAARAGHSIDFILMPYPTPARYLTGDVRKYVGVAEKQALLTTAFESTLRNMVTRPGVPAVLGAHVNVRGATIGAGLFRLDDRDDVPVSADGLAERFAYVALGHIHKPQALGGHDHIRYSGSPERLDLGEATDAKGVVIVEIGPNGLTAPARTIPLPATTITTIAIQTPAEDLPKLRAEFEGRSDHLVSLDIRYMAGVDSLEAILSELDDLFPRWYARRWTEASRLQPTLVPAEEASSPRPEISFRQTVRDYVQQELQNHSAEEQASLLDKLDAILTAAENEG
ncbi:MAG: metallophosphoesterase family protein [Gemmataceae bacterium]